jgi:hypothetical protein
VSVCVAPRRRPGAGNPNAAPNLSLLPYSSAAARQSLHGAGGGSLYFTLREEVWRGRRSSRRCGHGWRELGTGG